MRLSRSVLALLILPACATETDQPFITGNLASASTTGSSGASTATSTSGLPTTTGDGPTGEPGTSSSGIDPSDPGTSTSSSSGEPGTGGTSSSGEPGSSGSSSGGSHCEDGAKNEDETDLDCGGSCPACVLGAACLLDFDCGSEWCDAGTCAVPGCLLDGDCDGFDTACIESTCDPLTKTCALAPVNDGLACEGDGDLCTAGGVCDKGGCLNEQPVVCGGLDNFCGTGECDPGTGGCVAVAKPGSEGLACDDGFSCTPNDSCASGLCGAGGPGYLFFEDFSAPAPGWELGATWAIGAAAPSIAGYNGADPDADHSPGPDEMLAGVVIGGLLAKGEQPKTCLSSPEIAVPGEGPLWLTFWRHLHTDFFPFVVHTVEAFDGQDWQELEIGYANPGIEDLAWTFLEYDISGYAGPKLRVRVCYSHTPEALAHAGWSLDDLTVGPYSCTPTE
ncbi:MAG: hypothetical protein H0T76_03440 [Nannocystis sp.]|nr:hypothetical protein [Nannocystis sp.]MBA3545516.1 hypothetical protein [Nannocystis sp.]